MTCECAKYDHIELFREEITKRIKQSRKLKRRLETIGERDNADKLLKCPDCQQYWQSSFAWNWGNREYLFKVPDIGVEEWIAEPYVRPDEMLLFSALMHDYIEKNTFIEKNVVCKKDGCENRAIQYSVFCRKDHVAAMQKAGALPKFPEGQFF